MTVLSAGQVVPSAEEGPGGLVSAPYPGRGSTQLRGMGKNPSAASGRIGEFVRDAGSGLSNPPILPS